MHFIIELFNHYGYIVLLFALMLELLALPLPGEALMTYCGYVVYTNKMSWPISIIVASLGVITGISLSYLIGKMLGVGFFEKYGHYMHMDRKRLDRISIWFERYGSKLLFIAYFIPGVRHVTGYFSGITKVSYKKFAFSAYLGAFIWTATFISLGKVLGANWEKYHVLLKKYLVIGSLIIAVIIAGIYVYRNYRQSMYNWIISILDRSLVIFHSLGKIKVIIAGIAALFLVFSVLVIGIIQDYLANEFSQFDEITRYLVVQIFDVNWKGAMQLFNNMSNVYVLLTIASFTVLWIAFKGTNKAHEIKFLSISLMGAVLLDYILKIIFHRLGPSGAIYTFPSSEVLISIVAYGFLAYMVLRQFNRSWVSILLLGAWFAVSFLIGLSMVYFNTQYASDVAAGFEFGVLWLCLCIILLEVYRVLPNIGNR